MSHPGSKRFRASKWMEWLIPIVLLLLLIGLLTSLAIILFSLSGLTLA